MSWSSMLWILLSGIGAGILNTIAGVASLITFPTLVALGFPVVTASISNSIGLVAGGISGSWAYRRELLGQEARLRWQVPASFLGALCGSYILLHLPEKVFARVVPVLIVLAISLVLAGPRIQNWLQEHSRKTPHHSASQLSPARMTALVIGTFLVGVYGGYFAAAQGILILGVMGALLPESMQRINASKIFLVLVVNMVAAVSYTLTAFHRVSWLAAGLIALGSLIGGYLGGHFGRNLSPNVLRVIIVVLGLIGLYRVM